MKHLFTFESFVFERYYETSGSVPKRSPGSTSGESLDWFNRQEMNKIRVWARSRGESIDDSSNESNGGSYWGTPEGVGLKDFIKSFFKEGGILCNEVHLMSDSGEIVITKQGGVFSAMSETEELPANNIDEILSSI